MGHRNEGALSKEKSTRMASQREASLQRLSSSCKGWPQRIKEQQVPGSLDPITVATTFLQLKWAVYKEGLCVCVCVCEHFCFHPHN